MISFRAHQRFYFRLRQILLLWAVLALGRFAAGATPLVLELVQLDGPTLRNFQWSEAGGQLVTPDGLKPVPTGRWTLNGDLKENFDQVAWSHPFALQSRIARPGPDAASRMAMDAVIELKTEETGLWSLNEMKGGLAVFAWLVRGRISQVKPVPLRAIYLKKGESCAIARFPLSPHEEQGSAILLLWREGRWIPPPDAPDAATRELLASICLGGELASVATLTTDLRAISPINALRVALTATLTASDTVRPAVLAAIAAQLRPRDPLILLAACAASGRTSAGLEILKHEGPRLGAADLAQILQPAIANQQDDFATALVEWADLAGRRNGDRDDLTQAAFRRGMIHTTTALAGSDLPKFIHKYGAEEFAPLAQRGQLPMIRFLLDKGISPAKADPQCHALRLAIALHDLPAVSALLAAGAKVLPATASTFPPLIYAVRAGSIPITELLAAYGADLNRPLPDDTTVLQAAVSGENVDLVPWLLAHGAKVDLVANGPRPLEIALVLRRPAVVSALVAAGARQCAIK